MSAPQQLDGPYGRAVRIDIPPHVRNASESVAVWIVTAPAYHPLWQQYLLSVIRLREVPGLPSPNYKFTGATHEMLVAALDPEHGPYRAKDIETLGQRLLLPINIAEQFTASDDEMILLATFTARGVIDGDLNPETGNAATAVREAWLASMVRTLAHLRGEPHAPATDPVTPQCGPFMEAGPGEHTEIAVYPAVSLLDEVNATRVFTHDQLVQTHGSRRRSGVRWRESTGAQALEDFETLDQSAGDDRTRAAHDQMKAFLREHGDAAVLVIAMCEVAV